MKNELLINLSFKKQTMTTEQLLKKARYFGGSIGMDFIYNNKRLTCAGVLKTREYFDVWS